MWKPRLFVPRSEGWGPVAGMWNGCMVMIIAFLTLLLVIGVVKGLMTDTPETGEQIGVVSGPVEVEVREDQCLILRKAEDNSPDYRLGEGEECEEQ